MRRHDEDKSTPPALDTGWRAPEHDKQHRLVVERSVVGAANSPLDAAAVHWLQRSAGNDASSRLVEREDRSPVLSVLESSGSPIDPVKRMEMESRLGEDFSTVRIHTGAAAADSARSVQAMAYTVGEDIVFNDGQYAPETPAGDHTLIHELSHVVQQRSGTVDGTAAPGGIAVSDPDDRFELAAEATANALTARGDASVFPSSDAPSGLAAVQREEADEDFEE